MTPWFARSAWLWSEATGAIGAADLAAFAARQGVREVWVSVPWQGPTRRTAAVVRALEARGIVTACLGGDPEWAMDASPAVAWTTRCLDSGLFTRVHLDIEPWALPSWCDDAAGLLAGLHGALRAVVATDAVEVGIDLPAWLARDHPTAFTGMLRTADAVTIMAYRDRADTILADAEAAVRIAALRAKPWRIGVDAVPAFDPRTTFFDDGRDMLARQTAQVAASLAEHPGFAGIAVHDLGAWRELRP